MQASIKEERGQSLFEVLAGIAIATLIVGSSVAAIIVSLRSSSNSLQSQKGYAIAADILDNVQSYAEADWAGVYNLSDKTANGVYHLEIVATTSEFSTLGIATGTELVTFSSGSPEENIQYTTWFSVENVPRSVYNVIGSGIGDPATQKVTARVSWDIGGDTRTVQLVQYLSKVRTRTIGFDDWSGSSGVVGPVTGPTSDYYNIVDATITASGDITY
jgi:hypothetical protein